VCTAGDTVHIDTIFIMLTRVWQQLEYSIDVTNKEGGVVKQLFDYTTPLSSYTHNGDDTHKEYRCDMRGLG